MQSKEVDGKTSVSTDNIDASESECQAQKDDSDIEAPESVEGISEKVTVDIIKGMFH